MGIFSKFESHMEDGLEGAADKMFDAPISPVQISKKAERAMRREKMVGAGKQYAPTLYTILVNPEDDQRLFGYYPTLAGETETYLSARASEQGLLMDGQPLVRFIVDDGLKHGKFDVVAELVSAPIIEQLRQEEFQRYGLDPKQEGAQPRRGGGSFQNYGQRRSTPLEGRAQNAQATPYAQPARAPQQQGYAPQAGAQRGASPYGAPAPAPRGQQGYQPQQAAPRPQQRPTAPAPSPQAPQAQGVRDFSQIPSPAAAAPATPADQQRTTMLGGNAGGATPGGSLRARLLDASTNRVYTLSRDRLIIGRSRQSDIVLDDLNASRSHAELRFDPQSGWSITDLGSTNGTLVNDRVVTSQPLSNGDRITIGMTDLVFQTE